MSEPGPAVRRTRGFPDLRSYVSHLASIGQLRRIRAEVDPVYEVSELVQRVIREAGDGIPGWGPRAAAGPALLFERVKGSDFPLVMNLFGSSERIRIVLGREPAQIGRELVEAVQRLNPPSLRSIWGARGLLARARHMRPRTVRSAPAQEIEENPDLERLPHLKTWPRDGGRFVTFGPTLTQDPRTGRRNFGLYRLQVFGPAETGMHWQSMKGGRGHHFEAERLGQALPAAVVLGGDPILMLSAILPLPEDVDELAFAGFLRGAPTPMVRARTMDLLVPASADFILEGEVPAGVRRLEGPFGDHFGHYSEAEEFPVFRVKRLTRRRDALYPASVVGKPPQEDKWMGIAVGEVVGPLIRLVNPNIVDLAANDAAGFHNLLVVACKERHPKEALKTAFNLLGTGQLSLTKTCVLLREDVNPRDFPAMLRELWYRFDPEERMLLIPIAPLDTLDYTSFRLHVGSKLVLDATGEPVTSDAPPAEVVDPATLDHRVLTHRLLDGGFLVVMVKRDGRAVLHTLVRHEALGPVKFVVAVSDDVDLADLESTIWGIWTRFDPARDLVFAEQGFVGARPVYRGRVGLDATWKEGYPLPLTMPDEVVRLVDSRWNEYWS
ncbi:MAG TPA: UbiD family decarboxylase [Gemmatimonadales bacterium]|nr:UbiD family decarboxylase [Gemmatimonadales bacterium]